jgi:hypothetical protein
MPLSKRLVDAFYLKICRKHRCKGVFSALSARVGISLTTINTMAENSASIHISIAPGAESAAPASSETTKTTTIKG